MSHRNTHRRAGGVLYSDIAQRSWYRNIPFSWVAALCGVFMSLTGSEREEMCRRMDLFLAIERSVARRFGSSVEDGRIVSLFDTLLLLELYRIRRARQGAATHPKPKERADGTTKATKRQARNAYCAPAGAS